MLDTNILISAFIFKSQIMNRLIEILSKEHEILISSYTIKELEDVMQIKFNIDKKYLKRFLNNFKFELVNVPSKIRKNLFDIRDEDDYIILYTAIYSDTDIFITGDKDFQHVKLAKPKIMTASEFLENL